MLVGAGILGALAGCASLRYGTPPHVDRLGTLRRGVATSSDVLLALGQPRGRGVTRFSASSAPQTIWVYEYGTIESGMVGNVDLQSALLLVFIEADRYVGYLWFSSSSSLERTSGFVWTRSGARP